MPGEFASMPVSNPKIWPWITAIAVAFVIGFGLRVFPSPLASAFAALMIAVAIGVSVWRHSGTSIAQILPTPTSLDAPEYSAERMRLLESAVVHANDAVVILEAQPRQGLGRAVLYANEAFCRMTGYSRQEVLGRSLHILRGPESDPITLAAIRDALAQGNALQVELRNYRKDGTDFWVDLSLVPVPYPAGVASHWVMIQRDITDRKRALDAVRRSEALFRSIFEDTSAGVSLTDRAGRFVSCNPAFAAMVGRTPSEVVRLNPADITHPDDAAAQVPLMAELVAGKRDRFHLFKRYVRPDGELVWAELSVAAVRGPIGEFEYGVGVSLNVTDRRKLEEQLRHAQKMEAVGRIAGGVAHDFNNLLTALMCNLDQVKLPANDPNTVHLMVIEQAAKRAADLTCKLLGYARRNQLVSVPVRLADALGEAAGLLRHTFDPRINLIVKVPADCPSIQADPALLSQVLLNLCLNSRDAMPNGGTLTLTAEPVEVTEATAARQTTHARTGRFICLSVADTGIGMTDEVKARLFEPFFTTKGVGKGTGLGLPMVHGIVEQHRGWVTCESTPGVGTRFDLYFPLAAPALEEESVGEPSPSVRSAAPANVAETSASGASGASGATVLFVDDEPMIREVGRTVLERAGYNVLTANDGVEAADIFAIKHSTIDLVVLDVTMPRMSGRDAFGKLVATNPQVKVLFSTGYSAEEVAELNGAVGLLSKPYRPKELLEAVQAALCKP